MYLASVEEGDEVLEWRSEETDMAMFDLVFADGSNEDKFIFCLKTMNEMYISLDSAANGKLHLEDECYAKS